MKALILNSGTGSRMGELTSRHPKCMTNLLGSETILSRQLVFLQRCGVEEVVLTTGLFDEVLVDYCKSLGLKLNISYVNNPLYDKTNYIYSIYLARHLLNDDIVLMHGDLVFTQDVIQDVLAFNGSCMAVSSTLPLPQKDFKAVLAGGYIQKIGIEFFENALAAQPLYRLAKQDWSVWLDAIIQFCEAGQVKCYAENAFNTVSHRCCIQPLDVAARLCAEIDTPEDLLKMQNILRD